MLMFISERHLADLERLFALRGTGASTCTAGDVVTPWILEELMRRSWRLDLWLTLEPRRQRYT